MVMVEAIDADGGELRTHLAISSPIVCQSPEWNPAVSVFQYGYVSIMLSPARTSQHDPASGRY